MSNIENYHDLASDMCQHGNFKSSCEKCLGDKGVEDKKNLWQQKIQELENVADWEGKGIDKGIIETVAAFNLNGFNTSQSCEGHIDEGVGAPWVSVEAPNEPEWQHMGQQKIFEEVAKKYNLSVEELKHAYNLDALQEANELAMQNEETPKFKQWCVENNKLLDRMALLLDDFYKGRDTSKDIKLEIESNRYGAFKIHNGGKDYERESTSLSESERKELGGRLEKYRSEMGLFSDYLKLSYFKEK